MKKLLLATSILAGSAGVAAAEVTFKGSAYMGMSNEFAVEFGGDTTDFAYITRVRVAISMSGTTDGGLTFGAGFDMHNAGAAGSSDADVAQGSATAYLEGEFGKITFGDTGSASDNLIGNVDGVGLALPGGAPFNAAYAPFGFQELGYGMGLLVKTGVKYEKSMGNFTVAVSTGQTGALVGYDFYSIAGKYTFADNYTVYLGFENASNGGGSESQTTVGADATFGNFTVKARASDWDAAPDMSWALSGTGTFDAISVTAFYANHYGLYSAYGVGGAYDLGGGAKFKAGYQETDLGGGRNPMIDMGLSFDF